MRMDCPDSNIGYNTLLSGCETSLTVSGFLRVLGCLHPVVCVCACMVCCTLCSVCVCVCIFMYMNKEVFELLCVRSSVLGKGAMTFRAIIFD